MRRKGHNVKASNEQTAAAIEKAARGGDSREIVKHKGHILPDGSKGMPHYKTKGVSGHSFWSGALAFIGSFLDPFDAIAGELADDEEYLLQQYYENNKTSCN